MRHQACSSAGSRPGPASELGGTRIEHQLAADAKAHGAVAACSTSMSALPRWSSGKPFSESLGVGCAAAVDGSVAVCWRTTGNGDHWRHDAAAGLQRTRDSPGGLRLRRGGGGFGACFRHLPDGRARKRQHHHHHHEDEGDHVQVGEQPAFFFGARGGLSTGASAGSARRL